ncbi:hypothetical protein MMAG44476_20079 [Mycolicibacterium mageritense DSM 44476 = CIP 104973]|uniref:Uncharacterized protein n=1 Tax=Mycolicibacterium mageritense TaxID=53462 RepID=A0ABM7I6E7_MYCME|nr:MULTISPECIES: hypothetical protein [Mycobacteriaceae]MDO3357790.1 hypothetical protein [Mycobacteroides abscessus subsp. massiliense]WKE45639.1 hypothetical protein P3M63_07495 [Mycobacteroides abscessus subsp. massiliense]CDO24084.1 hypothetical protein BN978_04576 [Mycolicibacterium mageritense DSM 44476 = CIP 104973]SLH66526.1 Uncharacterised protein [Mycobacteroides abscessus subsp. abscessus]BBX35963.1 hypothetical protein MMAGJ_52450 [Mycolicibacterium mageritense]
MTIRDPEQVVPAIVRRLERNGAMTRSQLQQSLSAASRAWLTEALSAATDTGRVVRRDDGTYTLPIAVVPSHRRPRAVWTGGE